MQDTTEARSEIKQPEVGGKFIDGASRVVAERLSQLNETRGRVAGKILAAPTTVRIVLLATLLIAAGCGYINPSQVDSTGALPGATAVAQTEPETLKSQYTEWFYGNMVFFIDDEGNPVGYKGPDGKEIKIDQDKLKATRQKALASTESEVFDIIPIPEGKQEEKLSNKDEHPVLKELPSDTLTPEELEKFGVEIIQADNTDLYIRKGAFEKGGPLADYKGGKYHLRIVLLNAPIVSDIFMQDPKYDEVKNILLRRGSLGARLPTSSDVEAYRKQQISQTEEMMANFRQKKEANVGEESLSDAAIGSLKVKLLTYQRMSPEELLAEIPYIADKDVAGLFTLGKSYPDGQSESIVFVAAGKTKVKASYIAIIYDSKGKIGFSRQLSLKKQGFEPRADHSFPNPDDFKLNTKASSDKPWTYPYGGQTTGQVLRHELAHDDLIRGPLRKINEGIFRKPDGLPVNYLSEGEYNTDMQAMEGIRQAWQKWVDSGFKDNSGYYFVFSLPDNKGYILTRNEKTGGLKFVIKSL